jgi:serine/threonine protein phosphatase PrpC
MTIQAAAYSSKGRRSHNEDSFLIAGKTGTSGAALPGGGGQEDIAAAFEGGITSPCFFAVADGMGGHDAGDAASAFVVEKLRDAAASCTGRFDAENLERTIKAVHASLLAEGKKRGTANMGSTLTGLVLQNDAPPGFFNAGDSRGYRLRNGFIRQLTRDDSLSSVVPGAAKNIITNAVGAGLPDVSVASRFASSVAVPGDIFLFCSDGVHGFVSDDEMETALGSGRPLPEIAEHIVKTAIANNSDDNCTAVVVKIPEQRE